MREILFRGKRVDNGEWVYGNYKKNIYSTASIANESDFYWNRVVPETLGQYTGMTDKNSTKIFEGDKVIVNCDDEEFGIVVWDNEESEYEIDSDGCRLKLGCFYSRNLEVIGNTHDVEETNE